MLKIFIIILAFLLTFLGVELFRRWSLRKDILDLPNERSSHTKPTPVGGGLIIVIVCLSSHIFFSIYHNYEIQGAYVIGALTVSLISWLDDLYHIPVTLRFLCHSFAACLAIWGFGGFSSFYIPFFGELNLNYFAPILLFFWIVWMINAYNFMDGIDGIAGIQAITASTGWILIAYGFGLESTGFYADILAASSFGFILLNWQPAKIFMGDVGSAFLGYTFALMPLMAGREMPEKSSKFFIASVLLLWLFIFDTVITVIIRILEGKKIWKAHREHLYQRIVIRGFSHQFVTVLYGICSSALIIFLVLRIFYTKNIEILAFSVIILISAGIFVFGRKDFVLKC